MAQVFCPECGNSITLENTRQFCFCTQCGTKIDISNHTASAANVTAEQSFPDNSDNFNQEENYLEEKLKEVEFYYKLSYEKKEYANEENQPTYYVKAQDILVDLSGEYEDDYRIWWYMSKPVDYMCTELVPACRHYEMNEMYFQKALDAAKIADKMEIIKAHDEYIERKKIYFNQIEKQEQQRIEKEKAERERQEQEEREKLQQEKEKREQEEREKLQQEKEEREKEEKAAQERAERERVEREEREKQAQLTAKEEQERYENEIQPLNNALWEDFNNKNYEKIDGVYFSYTDEKSDIITVVIKKISNMLHLIAYKKMAQNNTLYNMQTITVKTDNKGTIIGFDNKPIVLMSNGSIINIHYGINKTLKVNVFDLVADADYIDYISKIAKKPLIKSKIFR